MPRGLATLASRTASWAARADFVLLALVFLFVLSVWSFVAIADEVHEGETRTIDVWILRSLRVPENLADPLGPLWFEDAVRDITALGSTAVLALITLFVTGFLLITGKLHTAALVLSSTTGGLLLVWLLKSLFSRPRPTVVPMLAPPMLASFPSGHTVLASVVYVTMGAILAGLVSGLKSKMYILGTALALAFLVGVSRIYLGVHYPTDVLAGWTLGLAWALLCWIVAQQLRRRRIVETLDK